MSYIIKRNLIVLLLLIVFVLPVVVHAGEVDPLFVLDYVATEGGYAGDVDEYSMSKMVGSIIASFLSLLGIIFVVLMIYGGFKWMKASGREDEVGKAQDIIRNAIIGLILTASSYAIYSFVLSGLLT